MCVRGFYSLSVKSLSCRVSLSTMDCLFDFNKACMNEKSHHLTDVSAMQGDKQGRAGGQRVRGEMREGGEVVFFSCGRPFRSTELCQAVSWQTKKATITFCFSMSQQFSIFHNNAAFPYKWIPVLISFLHKSASAIYYIHGIIFLSVSG